MCSLLFKFIMVSQYFYLNYVYAANSELWDDFSETSSCYMYIEEKRKNPVREI